MFPAIEQHLHHAGTLLTAVLLARLLFNGLARVYIFFAIWLGFSLLRSGAIELVSFTRSQYFQFYLVTEMLNWCFSALVVMEIGGRALVKFPGIRTWGRRAIWTTVGVTLGVTVLCCSFIPNWMRAGFFFSGTLAHLGLGLALIFVVIFLVWFPVPLSRNVALHTTLFTAYFFSKGFLFLWMAALRTQPQRSLSMAILLMGSCCLVVWIVMLRPAGETVAVRQADAWSQAEEIRLVAQLQALANGLDRRLGDSRRLLSDDPGEDAAEVDDAHRRRQNRDAP